MKYFKASICSLLKSNIQKLPKLHKCRLVKVFCNFPSFDTWPRYDNPQNKSKKIKPKKKQNEAVRLN